MWFYCLLSSWLPEDNFNISIAQLKLQILKKKKKKKGSILNFGIAILKCEVVIFCEHGGGIIKMANTKTRIQQTKSVRASEIPNGKKD